MPHRRAPESQGRRLARARHIDTNTAGGKLILHVIGAIAEFERQIMLERQREGIAKAKAEGKYKGQAPTARRQADKIIALARGGKTKQAIADELKINIGSVFAFLRKMPTGSPRQLLSCGRYSHGRSNLNRHPCLAATLLR
jgi:DNA invertase Pin-like site-specific DNA recombinase